MIPEISFQASLKFKLKAQINLEKATKNVLEMISVKDNEIFPVQ